jgi:hypothetical protein
MPSEIEVSTDVPSRRRPAACPPFPSMSRLPAPRLAASIPARVPAAKIDVAPAAPCSSQHVRGRRYAFFTDESLSTPWRR